MTTHFLSKPLKGHFYCKSSQSHQDTQHHYVLVMFVLGLLNANGIVVVDILEQYVLLFELFILAKITRIPPTLRAKHNVFGIYSGKSAGVVK